MELYYQPHSSRKREAQFVEHLIRTLPITTIHKSYFPLPESLVERAINIRAIERLVPASQLTPLKKKRLLLELASLPDEIQIVNAMANMTCDVVIVAEGIQHYLEFHEEQHRNLTSKRQRHVLSVAAGRVTTPRFVQRLLRDVWRFQHMLNFSVVWADWFEANIHDYQPQLVSGNHEFAMNGKFTIASLVPTSTAKMPTAAT